MAEKNGELIAVAGSFQERPKSCGAKGIDYTCRGSVALFTSKHACWMKVTLSKFSPKQHGI